MNGSVLIIFSLFWAYNINARKIKGEIISSVARRFQVKFVCFLYSTEEDYKDSHLLFILNRYLSDQYIFSQSGSCYHQETQPNILHVILHEKNAPNFLNKKTTYSGFWLMYIQSDISLDKVFTGINIPLDSEFLVVHPEDGNVVLTEVYRVSPSLPLQKLHFGKWNTHTGLISQGFGFYERRRNLQGINLIGTVKEGPATIVVKKNNEEILQIGGFIGKLWNILMNMGNFTTKYVRAEENAFGTDINGTRTGLLGMLQRKEIDVASTDILMDTSRLDIVDFIVPLFEVRTYMFTRDPENVESDWKSFLEPFSINIWLFIIGTITVLTIMLHATLTTERYIMPPDQYSSLQFKPYDGFFSILSSFCLQGQNWWLHLPESSRILVVTSYLTALVLIVGYSGFLVSYLSLRKTVLPFNTFSQFLNDGTYQLGVLNNSIHYAYFEESKDPIMIKLFKKYISNNKNDHPRSFLEGLHRICSFNRYNFMAPVFIVGGLIQQLECRITEVPQAFIPATATMGLVKNSPYQGIFSYYVKRVQRSGVLKKLRKNYLTLKLDRTLITTERHGADFESLKPLIIFLALGFVMATLVLALERTVIKKRKRIRTRRKRTQKLKQLLKTSTNENG